MLALAGANAVGVVLFGALYAAAGARRLSQSAFLVCLVMLFLLVTGLWVRIEARHRALGVVRRVGRVMISLVTVVAGTPMVVLMPLYWLETQLPPDAGLSGALAPVMALVLVSLALVASVNVTGAVVAAGLALVRRRTA